MTDILFRKHKDGVQQTGPVSVFFMGGGQIDGRGNINLVGTGDYPRSEMRFPGSFGTPYLYSLDYAELDFFGASSISLGARAVGSPAFGSGKFNWLAEYARQSDTGDNPNSYDANYTHLNGAYVAGNGMTIGLGYEVLGADSSAGVGFTTPLATLHAFNGWAEGSIFY